jgi:hypothetical protein
MRERLVVSLGPYCVARSGSMGRRTSPSLYDGTIDQHPAAGSAAQSLADGTPEGITGRVRRGVRGGEAPRQERGAENRLARG